jgi:hypothetical protein
MLVKFTWSIGVEAESICCWRTSVAVECVGSGKKFAGDDFSRCFSTHGVVPCRVP